MYQNTSAVCTTGYTSNTNFTNRDPGRDSLQHQDKKLKGYSEKNQDEEEKLIKEEKENRTEELENSEGNENHLREEVNVNDSFEICLKDKRYTTIIIYSYAFSSVLL